jgi:hypothetical protein
MYILLVLRCFAVVENLSLLQSEIASVAVIYCIEVVRVSLLRYLGVPRSRENGAPPHHLQARYATRKVRMISGLPIMVQNSMYRSSGLPLVACSAC